MRNLRSYYSASLTQFLQQPTEEILGTIHANNATADTTIQQSNTWEQEIAILKDQLSSFNEGQVIVEYTIPRMGKRVDVVLLHNNIVFLLEFKCGASEYHSTAYDQVYDYALDLRNFHKESHHKLLVPIVISTLAPSVENTINNKERILMPLRCNAHNLTNAIQQVSAAYNESPFDYHQWEESEYLPTNRPMQPVFFQKGILALL